jgi:hypothetical protein
MIPKLSGACHAITSMFNIRNFNTHKTIYFDHSTMKDGMILGGNLPNSERIFALETKIIRIMVGAKSNISG